MSFEGGNRRMKNREHSGGMEWRRILFFSLPCLTTWSSRGDVEGGMTINYSRQVNIVFYNWRIWLRSYTQPFSQTFYLLICYSFSPLSFFLLFCSWFAHGVPLCRRRASNVHYPANLEVFVIQPVFPRNCRGIFIYHFPFVTTETFLAG